MRSIRASPGGGERLVTGATPLLEIDGLRVAVRTDAGDLPVVDDVGFTLARGATLGIAGESGCGKSLTALAVMGLLPEGTTVSGRVVLDGSDLLGLDERSLARIRGRRVAMVFQEPMTALNPTRCIGAQVAEGPRRHFGIGRAEADRRAASALARVGLPPARIDPGRYPHQLSGGQRQRVMIAMAIACGPELLIADEPTTALDVTIQAQILDLLADLVAEQGMALMLITHDLGVLAETVERMMVMYCGQVVEAGTTAQVFSRLSHPYARGLFAAQPTAAPGGVPGSGRRLATIPGTVPPPGRRPPGCPFADRCPRADDRCRIRPPLAGPGDGHRVACFHPHADAPAAEGL